MKDEQDIVIIKRIVVICSRFLFMVSSIDKELITYLLSVLKSMYNDGQRIYNTLNDIVFNLVMFSLTSNKAWLSH